MSGKYMDYIDAKEAERFIILRHDIEFSIERAYKMSLLETQEGIRSTYFVQLTNQAYNTLSARNRELLKHMLQNGHHIGLHFHMNGVFEPHKICDGIRKETEVLSDLLNTRVDRFSIHRPTEESRYYELEVEGLINAYGKEFFTHFDPEVQSQNINVKYIADSKHRWNYGMPDEATIRETPKIQLLIHPYSWSEVGGSAAETFSTIAKEKELELLETFDGETKIFSEIKNDVIRLRGL